MRSCWLVGSNANSKSPSVGTMRIMCRRNDADNRGYCAGHHNKMMCFRHREQISFLQPDLMYTIMDGRRKKAITGGTTMVSVPLEETATKLPELVQEAGR